MLFYWSCPVGSVVVVVCFAVGCIHPVTTLAHSVSRPTNLASAIRERSKWVAFVRSMAQRSIRCTADSNRPGVLLEGHIQRCTDGQANEQIESGWWCTCVYQVLLVTGGSNTCSQSTQSYLESALYALKFTRMCFRIWSEIVKIKGRCLLRQTSIVSINNTNRNTRTITVINTVPYYFPVHSTHMWSSNSWTAHGKGCTGSFEQNGCGSRNTKTFTTHVLIREP